jgi:hypothetical protein
MAPPEEQEAGDPSGQDNQRDNPWSFKHVDDDGSPRRVAQFTVIL